MDCGATGCLVAAVYWLMVCGAAVVCCLVFVALSMLVIYAVTSMWRWWENR